MSDFINKRPRNGTGTTITTPVPIVTPNVIEGLFAVNVKTDVVDQSIKIVVGSNPVATFNINTINGWNLSGGTLTINSNTTPLILNFTSEGEGITAEDRLAQIVNGGNLS